MPIFKGGIYHLFVSKIDFRDIIIECLNHLFSHHGIGDAYLLISGFAFYSI
jgi:hypothetical protein